MQRKTEHIAQHGDLRRRGQRKRGLDLVLRGGITACGVDHAVLPRCVGGQPHQAVQVAEVVQHREVAAQQILRRARRPALPGVAVGPGVQPPPVAVKRLAAERRDGPHL